MKKKILVVAAALFLTPMMAGLAHAGGAYLIGKAGVYLPNDSDVDTGFNGEIGFGYNMLHGPEFLALEGTVGYFNAKKTEDVYPYTNAFGFQSNYQVQFKADVAPLALSLKAGIVSGPVMLYVGGGVDVLFVNMEMEYRNAYRDSFFDRFRYTDSDDDTIFGGHVMAGVTFDINPHMFAGAEIKYLATEDMDMRFFRGQDRLTGNLDGVTLTGVFGFRF